MSDTPRTDLFITDFVSGRELADFARTLEREVNSLTDTGNELLRVNRELCEERAESRRALSDANVYAQGLEALIVNHNGSLESLREKLYAFCDASHSQDVAGGCGCSNFELCIGREDCTRFPPGYEIKADCGCGSSFAIVKGESGPAESLGAFSGWAFKHIGCPKFRAVISFPAAPVAVVPSMQEAVRETLRAASTVVPKLSERDAIIEECAALAWQVQFNGGDTNVADALRRMKAAAPAPQEVPEIAAMAQALERLAKHADPDDILSGKDMLTACLDAVDRKLAKPIAVEGGLLKVEGWTQPGPWIATSEHKPGWECRYLIVYRTKNERPVEKCFIGDYIPAEDRWMGLPGDVDVTHWMVIPAIPAASAERGDAK